MDDREEPEQQQEETDPDELVEPVPPIGTTEPLGLIELLREEIGGRLGRFFRRG